MNNYINATIRGILAGIAISFGGYIYLRTNAIADNTILGSFLFSFGLILICNFNFNLYTGKVGYLLEKNEYNLYSKIVCLLFILFGNLLGTFFFAGCVKIAMTNTAINYNLMENIKNIVQSKINYTWYQMIFLSFLCGILVYLAVEGFNKIDNIFGKYVVLILAISGFIISGFEHSIANMFYYFLASNFTISAFVSLLLCIIGNSLGGLFIPATNKLMIVIKNMKK